MNQPMSALIVAPPGLLRVGLRAALTALAPLETVGEADSAMHAMDMVHDPSLVLLSDEGPDNSVATIREIKARWPAAWCIVLVDTVAQQQAAKAGGADEVLIKGVRAEELLRRIEGLLQGEHRSGTDRDTQRSSP